MIFWMLPNSGLQSVADMKTMLTEFSAEHPDIAVEVRVLARRALWTRMFLSQREGVDDAVADLVQIPHYWTALFSRLGVITDLNDLDPALSANECIAPLQPHCFMPGTQRVHSVPWWMDVSALHYRVDHLQQIDSNPDALFTKWDGLLSACEALARNRKVHNYYPMENANARGSFTIREMLPCILNRGGDLFSQDLSRASVHREECLRGIEDYLALFRRGFMPLLRERGSLGTVAEGKASIVISRRQSESIFSMGTEGEVPVRTVPVPGELFGSNSYLSSYNLAIMREGTAQQEALTLLKWLTSNSRQQKYARLIDAFPCSNAAFEGFIFSSRERLSTYAAIVGSARTLPNITVCGTAVKILDEAMGRLASEIVKNRYSSSLLMQEMVKAQVEMDYLLSLYGD